MTEIERTVFASFLLNPKITYVQGAKQHGITVQLTAQSLNSAFQKMVLSILGAPNQTP